MPSRNPSKKDQAVYLEDILVNTADIFSFLKQMTFAEYTADLKTRRAVERSLQIVTEAGIRLGNEAPLLCPEIDWRSMRDFGNLLRHSYNVVSDEIIWDTIHDKLPELRATAQAALTALDAENAHP